MEGYAQNSPTERQERRSICFPRHGTNTVLQRGEHDFRQELRRLYAPEENNALEGLIDLKSTLKQLPTDEFWGEATEGISRLLGAEMAFVFKRVLVDEHDAAVEMPPIGEPGSCLMAAAFHYCSSDGSKDTIKQSKFHAYGCPCAYMRHDKVFVIPEALNNFITNNPNQLPIPAEAYIAVPLFAEGRCIAHFGAMWSKQAAARRKLSWAFIEMLLHALEEMICERFLDGSNFIHPASEKQRVVPHDAVTVAQSLRPYAGSLSHELRTPMQGVVGMLDVMYATVREAVQTQADPQLRKIFQNLQESIEIVQDSSRRAVEAADNVVHAYDMDMSVPEEPPNLPHDDPNERLSPLTPSGYERRPEILVAGSNLPVGRANKRRRDESRQNSSSAQVKIPRLDGASSVWSRPSEDAERVPTHQDGQKGLDVAVPSRIELNEPAALDSAQSDLVIAHNASRVIAPGLRHTNIREVIQYVINEGLKLGGRPDSALAQETDLGESIEVRTRGSDGTASRKIIEWSVDPNLPDTMFIDEKDLSKLVSCVFLNAIKFTDQTDGRVGIHARMSSRGRYISIKISDNGPGIPSAFLPSLFKAFSQENGSLTRRSDGLGLGLMVAKGIARKLGGDLTCVRAETEGPHHGCEFEIKVPIIAGEIISRPTPPFGSPMPRKPHLVTSDVPHSVPQSPRLPPQPVSPRRLSVALDDAASRGEPLHCADVLFDQESSPPSPKTKPRLTVPERTDSPPKSPKSPTSPTTLAPVHAGSRPRVRKSVSNPEIDRDLAAKYPLTFLVAEDNKINRKLLVSMLSKFGYREIYEAHDGAEAVRQMAQQSAAKRRIDVVLMDLWMPLMDGYEATERILSMAQTEQGSGSVFEQQHRVLDGTLPTAGPTVLAVTADVTDGALERAAQVGMKGFMTKPYKLLDLQRLITEYAEPLTRTSFAAPTVA